jgi:hypothetical protein
LKLSANRVVLFLHGAFIVATAAVVFITALKGSLPTAWQPDVAFAVTLLGAIAAGTVSVSKFLTGSQKFDALQSQEKIALAAVPPVTLASDVLTPDEAAAPLKRGSLSND